MKKIQQQRLERLKAIWILLVVSEKNILFEKQDVVATVFDKREAVSEQLVSGRLLVAE